MTHVKQAKIEGVIFVILALTFVVVLHVQHLDYVVYLLACFLTGFASHGLARDGIDIAELKDELEELTCKISRVV